LAHELLLDSVGMWTDAAAVDLAFLFEVNFFGARDFGLGAATAIDN
jgi:hypothetical protein